MKFIGLKNCDTCKKAQRWLKDHNVQFEYHDVRADGLSESLVQELLKSTPLETVVNKRSTTWRGLSEAEKSALTIETAPALLATNPTLLKRPVLISAAQETAPIIGFDSAIYESNLL